MLLDMSGHVNVFIILEREEVLDVQMVKGVSDTGGSFPLSFGIYGFKVIIPAYTHSMPKWR